MKNRLKLLAAPYLVWAFGFIIIPLILLFYYGFTTRDGQFTLDNITSIGTPQHLKALGLSLLLSFIATVLCLLLGYPLASVLSHMSSKTNLIIFIFILPMWMNFLLRTIAWQNLLEKNGVINSILGFFGISALSLINNNTAIILGMVYNFLPFMVLPLYNSISKVDPNVVNAARDLGANEVQTFLKITLPLTIPGIISGITMVFVPSLTTFVISTLLGGSKILLIGNVIEQQFTTVGNWQLGSGLSIVLMVFIIINMVISSIFDKEGGTGLI